MKALLRSVPVILFAIVLCHPPQSDASAYRTFGMFYPESLADQITQQELEWMQTSGFSWLMVQEKLTSDQLQMIHNAGFSLYVMVPEYFAIPHRLRNPAHTYFNRAEAMMQHYHHDSSVKGFGLLAYSNWHHTSLPGMLNELMAPYREGRNLFTLDVRPISGDPLSPFDGILLQTGSAGQLSVQLTRNPELAGILYTPDSAESDIRALQEVLEILSGHRDLPIFFERNWFVRNALRDTDPSETKIDQLTSFYAWTPDARVANPAPNSHSNDLDISILLLFILWAAYTVYYRLNPFYRRSVSRFFLNYHFFVNDVLMRRIRLPNDATVLFVLSGLMGGFMAFATAQMYLDPVAMGALMSYMPVIPSDWTHPFHFFGLFFFITLLMNFIQILWLRLANHEHGHTDQVASLMLWPQHMNMVFISAGVILLRIYPSEIVVVTMFLLFWTTIFLSFFITAYSMRSIHPTSPIYMLSTYALFVLVMSTLIFWLIYGLDILPAWNLASEIASYL